ncbi:hypothetical protein DM02DRAFT_440390 [Periconia macrospinosa]|uniref:Uncharacterized protein n=1 Tax=Periconia macrospinosa TaxID=97972 RepID=A0A2V1DLT2_9PLEO|nr:hypothetical protein DM02DRAFT_440390 [Periconia macrospinosa]
MNIFLTPFALVSIAAFSRFTPILFCFFFVNLISLHALSHSLIPTFTNKHSHPPQYEILPVETPPLSHFDTYAHTHTMPCLLYVLYVVTRIHLQSLTVGPAGTASGTDFALSGARPTKHSTSRRKKKQRKGKL